MDTQRDIVLPYIEVPKDAGWAAMRMSNEDYDAIRWGWVGKVFENKNRSLDEVPPAWKKAPLEAWCWLVLTINEIPFDPEVQRPLISYGIDFTFAPSPKLSAFFWAVS